MTYRQAIQKLQADINQVYESVGVLRDAASPDEKAAWNDARTATRDAWLILLALDNTIPDDRAFMELPYTV